MWILAIFKIIWWQLQSEITTILTSDDLGLVIHCIRTGSELLLFNPLIGLVKAWLQGAQRGHVSIDFHRWQQNPVLVLAPQIACVLKDGPIKKLSLCRVNVLVVTAFHDNEVISPAPRHFKVILRWGKRLRLSLFEGCTRLNHHFFGLFVFMDGRRIEVFSFGVLAVVDVSYSWQLIGWVGILYTEAVLKLLGPLVEILTIEGVILIVILAEGHIETVVPVGGLSAGRHVATLVPILLTPLWLWSVCVKRPCIHWILRLLEAVIVAISRVYHHLGVRHFI